MKYQIGLPILVLAFTACMQIKKRDDAANAQTEVKSEQVLAVISTESIQIKYVGQSKPNQYTAVISWPTVAQSTFRIINLQNENFETTENSISFDNLQSGKAAKMIFEQYSLTDQRRLASFNLILSPPEDFVFDGVVRLSENMDKTVERLFLTSTAKVFTNQFNLKIKAKNIYSEFGAMITNFPEGFTAEIEQVGLSGGKTEISAEVAVGNLQVLMNAQGGGEGRWGYPEGTYATFGQSIFVPLCYGNSGSSAGVSGSFFSSVQTSSDFQISIQMKIANGGLAGVLNTVCVSPAMNHTLSTKCMPVITQLECGKKTMMVAGPVGKPGQICTKMNANENFKCEKY